MILNNTVNLFAVNKVFFEVFVVCIGVDVYVNGIVFERNCFLCVLSADG